MSAQVGCGGYADDTVGAVSTTGHGESITRVTLASRVIEHIRAGQLTSNVVIEHIAGQLTLVSIVIEPIKVDQLTLVSRVIEHIRRVS